MFKPGIPVNTFTQATPATSWVIQHNFGMPIIIDTISLSNGVLSPISPQSVILSADKNTTTVTFATAVSGEARVVGYGGPPPPPPPVLDPYTVLLMHMDGTDGDTQFLNEKGSTSYSRVGNTIISTDVAKFGNASAKIGAGGSGIPLPTSSDFDMGAGAWTAEGWIYLLVGTGQQDFIGNSNPNFQLGLNYPGSGSIFSGAGGQNVTGTPFALGTWMHLAYSCEGATGRTYYFLDGVLRGSAVSADSADLRGAAIGNFGHLTGLQSIPLKGYIDEVRISKGIARYTSSFTPQTAPFTLYSN
jgi:hypothetical protein